MKKYLIGLMFLLLATCDIAFADELFEGPIRCSQNGGGHLTVGDFNNDNKMDVASLYNTIVSVSLGNGDGTCEPGASFISSPNYFDNDIISGDLNNDGNLDIVILTGWPMNSIDVYLGNGDGSFQEKQTYPTGHSQQITLGDFNGDGKLDIASANYWGSYRVTVLIGNGDGTFGGGRYFGDIYGRLGAYAIASGDFNGDGYIDLATANHWDCTVSVFMGKGDGDFEYKGDFTTGTYPRDILVADINGDGNMDLASSISYYADGSISLLFGNGDGTFQTQRILSSGWGVWGIAAADFDNNGTMDLVATNTSGAGIQGNTVSVFLGNGDATFQPRRNYSSNGLDPMGVIATDFNGDGTIDIVIGTSYSRTIGVLLNISNQPPIANAGPDQLVECAGPLGATVTLDGSGSTDPDGDALTYAWTWAGGSAEGVNPTVSLPFGTTAITLTVSDGKVTATDTVSITVHDTIPPVTTPIVTGIHGNNDWYISDVTVALSATDSGSGVARTEYSTNGTDWFTYTAPFVVGSEGITTIYYRSIDSAGNTETAKSIEVKIDKTLPTLTISATPDRLWSPNGEMMDVTIGGGVSDDGSGVTSLVFTVTDEYGLVQPTIAGFNSTIQLEARREGSDDDGRTYTITVVATDIAGNRIAASTVVLVPHSN